MAKARFQFLRDNWAVVGVFVVASVAALWFTASIVLDVIYFNDPRHKDQDLKGWMTPRYVSMSYDLPRPLVLDVLGLSENTRGGRPLRDIAQDLGLTLEELTERVRAAAVEHRAAQARKQ